MMDDYIFKLEVLLEFAKLKEYFEKKISSENNFNVRSELINVEQRIIDVEERVKQKIKELEK